MLTIQPYYLEYQEQVINLILDIQQHEFAVSITIDQQPDLLKISEFYQIFWAKSGSLTNL